MKKLLILVSLLTLVVSFLSAQSLAELSEKEKERREKLKGKTSVVLTNSSLKKARRPARVQAADLAADDEEEAGEEAGERAIPSRRIVPTERAPQEETETGEDAAVRSTADRGSADRQENVDDLSLEEKWEKAQEYVNLLNLKMNALWQEFYSMDDMTPRDHIQRQIAETYEKLQKAKEEEERLRRELGK